MENSTKEDQKQLLLLLSHAEKLVVEVRSLSRVNQSINLTTTHSLEPVNQYEQLRNAEIIIILCVLLLWCGSILIFIRHSELLRIRYRDIPYYPSIQSPMNLNHITVVHRVSDAVIHSKPTSPSVNTLVLAHSTPNRISEQGIPTERKSLSVPQPWNTEKNVTGCESNPSIKCADSVDHLLDPQMIPRDVRRRLLDLHRKSMDNFTGYRHSIQFTTNDLPPQQETDDEYQDITIIENINPT